jgi:hypothetical protein
MNVESEGARGRDLKKRADLRAALESGNQAAAIEIARQDLALVRNFANDMLKEIKPQLSLAARCAAIAAAPEEPVVHRELVRALILARKPEDAATHAKSMPFDEPALRKLFLDVAEDFLTEGRPKQAIATLEAMQQSWTLGNDARRVLLKAEVLTKRPEQAMERLNGFDLPPQERAVMLQYVAGRFEIQGDKAAALNVRKAAAAAAPQSFNVVLDYLTALKSMEGRPERIIEALEDQALQGADKTRLLRELAGEANAAASKQLALRRAAAEFTPEDVTLVHEYVRAVLDERGFDSALAALDDAAFDKADRVQVIRDMGGLLARAKRQDLALQCKAEAYKRAPERLGVLYELVDALLKSAGPAGARAYFDEAGVPTESLLATLGHFASHLAQVGQTELAVSCRRMMVHLRPQSPELMAELACTLMRCRGWDETVVEVDKSELSETGRVQVFRALGNPGRNDLDPAFAAACRDEVLKRGGVGHAANEEI